MWQHCSVPWSCLSVSRWVVPDEPPTVPDDPADSSPVPHHPLPDPSPYPTKERGDRISQISIILPATTIACYYRKVHNPYHKTWAKVDCLHTDHIWKNQTRFVISQSQIDSHLKNTFRVGVWMYATAWSGHETNMQLHSHANFTAGTYFPGSLVSVLAFILLSSHMICSDMPYCALHKYVRRTCS